MPNAPPADNSPKNTNIFSGFRKTLSTGGVKNNSSLSVSSTASKYSPPTYRLEDIPDDVWCEIAYWCAPPTILRLHLVCKRLSILLRSYLYHSVELAYTDLCRSAMKVFSQRPSMTCYIQALILKPNRNSGWANSSDKSIDELGMADVLEEIASHGGFSLLKTFKWYGKEMPRDSLWLVLRTNCLHLRNIGTSVGQKTLHSLKTNSQILGFRNLQGFHLFTQVLERWTMIKFHNNQDLPEAFWKMLLENQDLEELTLDGTIFSEYNAWHIERVLSGRWPRLRKLALGAVFNDDRDNNDELLCTFLQAHPNLEEMSTLGNMSYSSISMACLLSLPKLETYQGRLQQLKGAGALSQIRNLHLTDWFSPSANFGEVLGDLHYLQSMSVYINYLDNVHTDLDLYDRLLGKCSQLISLEISATSTLSLQEISTGLRHVPTLRTLMVTRVGKVKGSNLTKSAMLIATRNHNLRELTLRDVGLWDHVDQLGGIFRTKQMGCYTVEEYQGVRVLNIQEIGIGALRQHYSKYYTRTIS